MSLQVTDSLVIDFPWAVLADAYEQLLDAERFGEPDDVEQAKRWVEECREKCGLLGGLLFKLALEHCTSPLRDILQREFGQLGTGAYQEARKARRAAKYAVEETRILEDRIRELERRLDNITPGIGEPGLRRAI